MWLEQGFDDGSGGGKCISAIIKWKVSHFAIKTMLTVYHMWGPPNWVTVYNVLVLSIHMR